MENKDKIEIPFGAKDSELYECEYTIPDGYEAEIKDGKVIIIKKETKDERIRKEIIDFVKSRGGFKGDWIAWLEKQGEHAKFRNSIQVGDKVTRNQDSMLVNLSQLNRVAKKDEKQGEQKPAEWSEEDEKILSNIIKDLVHPYNEYIPDRIEDEIKWLKNKLKSLRPQNTWKPSDGQLDALQYVYRNLNPPLSDKLGWNSLKTLELMYQELKKLKE